MIQINKITPPTLEIYDPDNNSLGFVNEYEFLDIRVQIKELHLSGYSFIFKNQKFKIDKNGNLEYYPEGLLDTMSNYYAKLLNLDYEK